MATADDAEPTITSYLSFDHDRLDRLLVDAAAHVTAGHFDQARPVLNRFITLLLRHIRLENELLFPTFDRVAELPDGPTRVMRMEHREIEALLDALSAAVDRRDGAGFATAHAGLLGVLGDHNAKEEAIIYPMTDRHLPPDERSRMVATLRTFR